MRLLIVTLSIFATGCTFRLVLAPPTSPVPSSCALKVVDTRPDPDAMYFKGSGGTGRAIPEPSVSEAIRRAACASMPTASLERAATFVVTDFECTASGFLEIRYVVDLRGRLEIPGYAALALRRGNMVQSYEGVWPKACESTAKPIFSALATDIARAIQAYPLPKQ